MFAEEEWTEALPADAQPHAIFNAKPTVKHKMISKRRLKQTLQTLGSVPVWDSTRPLDDSDGGEANEEVPVHVNTTKKRCKKRKKIFDAESEGEQNGAAHVAEKPVKRRKSKEKPRERSEEKSLDGSVESAEDKDVKGQMRESSCPEDAAERKLSRQQWKNKMKNKNRCKNKFRHNSAEGTKMNVKEGHLEERQGKKTQRNEVAPVRVRSGEKSDVGISTRTSESSKTITGKESRKMAAGDNCVSKGPTVDGSVSKGPAAGNNAVCTSPCANRKIAKLRHILNACVTDSNNKLAAEEAETLEVDDEEKSPLDRSSALRSRMEKRLHSARFRYINELLYTSTSGEAKRMFKQDPDAIRIYHEGYVEQVKHWPANPVDSIISYIRQKPKSLVVADFGCGDCKIAQSVKNHVHCFDLAPVCDLVTACDMAKVPLDDCTVDIAVFCLSLMGTNLADFLAEANRVLRMGGTLKIAEVASRFDNIRQFIGALSHLGFKLARKDTDNSHFYSFEFVKVLNTPSKARKAGVRLRPCLYKKR